jgi:hypothetical protein
VRDLPRKGLKSTEPKSSPIEPSSQPVLRRPLLPYPA